PMPVWHHLGHLGPGGHRAQRRRPRPNTNRIDDPERRVLGSPGLEQGTESLLAGVRRPSEPVVDVPTPGTPAADRGGTRKVRLLTQERPVGGRTPPLHGPEDP